jgi:hypothetical protein
MLYLNILIFASWKLTIVSGPAVTLVTGAILTCATAAVHDNSHTIIVPDKTLLVICNESVDGPGNGDKI